jgi:hypothetical protein
MPNLYSNYTEEKADKICEMYANGMSLQDISLNLRGCPTVFGIMKWKRTKPDFAEKMRVAKQAKAEYFASKFQESLEKTAEGSMEPQRLVALSVGYKWFATKLDKENYGDSAQLSLADPSGQNLSLQDFITNPVPIIPQMKTVGDEQNQTQLIK